MIAIQTNSKQYVDNQLRAPCQQEAETYVILKTHYGGLFQLIILYA